MDVITLSKFLPVIHLFDNEGNRIKLISGSRNSIEYYGVDKIILSVCYKKIRRGMRTGAMNNMVSIDIQLLEKNIHVKLSANSITCVGTSGIDQGIQVFNIIKDYIYMLNSNINYCKNYKNKSNLLKWLFKNCTGEDNNTLIRLNEITKIINTSNFNEFDIQFLNICSCYIDEFDIIKDFQSKINDFLCCNVIFEEIFDFLYPSVYNSVYHCTLDDTIRIPLHKLAPYLSNLGLTVEFHNWNSEGCNICFPIEEYKDGHITKEYKHRFTIHERSTMRQCSPTYHDESYKFYKIIVKLINDFLETEDTVNYTEFIKETL